MNSYRFYCFTNPFNKRIRVDIVPSENNSAFSDGCKRCENKTKCEYLKHDSYVTYEVKEDIFRLFCGFGNANSTFLGLSNEEVLV